MQRTSYGFQLDPFAAVQNFAAAYSTGTNRPRVEYSLDLRTRSPVRGLLYVAYSGMDTVKYYGQGNETAKIDALDSADFYKLRQGYVVVNPLVEVTSSDRSGPVGTALQARLRRGELRDHQRHQAGGIGRDVAGQRRSSAF